MPIETVNLVHGDAPKRPSALFWYLRSQPTGGPIMFQSSYWAALIDARNSTGRNPQTGEVERASHSLSWIGAIGYLCFLDQLGTAIRLRNSRAVGPSPVERCLADFDGGATTKRDRAALYALRCSLAHNYSLFNIGQRTRAAELSFRFRLTADPAEPLVAHARRRWTGSFDVAPRPSQETTINLRALGDTVESVHRNVQELYGVGRVESRLPPAHLLTRYFMWFGGLSEASRTVNLVVEE